MPSADNEAPEPPAASASPWRFGDYDLLRELGRGGMGVVYEARHRSLNRTVALKMLHPTRLASAAQLQRFRQEAEAVAALDHPAILPIYEIGETHGQPYFTMKLAEGGSLAARRDARTMLPERATLLLACVARAVHFAHQRGIQHRDLKPGNILLDAEGRPYVSDFGLAKFADRDSSLTLSTEVLGSPAYMAPEQAAGDSRNVTTAADIYALGAICYELLTGRPPFVADNVPAVMRKIAEEEPDGAAIADVDLRTLCLKCLSKDPRQRYSSAEAVADELDRWRRGEPIHARPVSEAERFARWCRRRPALAGALAALALALVGGIAGVALQWRRAEEHSRQREIERYAADMQLASHAFESHDLGLARRMLAAQIPAPGLPDWRGFEWHLLNDLCRGDHTATLTGHTATVTCVALAPDGSTIASGGMDATVVLWNRASQTIITNLREHRGVIWSVGFTPDGQRVISAGADRKVRFWTRDGRPAEPPLDGQNAALSADGTRLAASMSSPFRYFKAEPGLKVWDWPTRRLVFETNLNVRRVALSADGRWLAAGGERRDLLLWNLETRESRKLKSADTPWTLAFAPDGNRLAAAGFDLGARIWDLGRDASPPLALAGHQFSVWGIAFSPDSRRVATCGSDRTLQLREIDSPDQVTVLAGHGDEVWDVAWDRDGRTLATASKDMTVRLWSGATSQDRGGWPNRSHWTPRFSRSGTRLLTMADLAGGRANVVLRDTRSGTVVTEFGSRWIAGFGDNGEDVVLLDEGTLQIERWLAAAGQTQTGPALAGARPAQALRAFDLSASGVVLALADHRAITLWNTTDGRAVAAVPWTGPYPLLAMALSPDGRHLAFTATAPYTIWLHDVRAGRTIELTNHTEEVKGLAFSLDGQTLASAGVDRIVRLWRVGDGRLIGELVRYFEEASGVAFSPDGRLLASVGVAQSVNLWHLPTQREVMFLSAPTASDRVAFSPSGDTLAFTVATNGVRLLRASRAER